MTGPVLTLSDLSIEFPTPQGVVQAVKHLSLSVDMGRRVGFVGGREGNRMRKPMARRVRIVLDGTRVITACPL